MTDPIFNNQFNQYKINRDHEQRLRASERQVASISADYANSASRLIAAVTAILDQLAENQLLTADEADALRAMLPPISAPLEPMPAEALEAMTRDVAVPESAADEADAQAAALAAVDDSGDASEDDDTDDEPSTESA